MNGYKKVRDYLEHCGFKSFKGGQVWCRNIIEKGLTEVIDFREKFVKVYAYKLVDDPEKPDKRVEPRTDHLICGMHAMNMMLKKDGRLNRATMFDLSDKELEDLNIDVWEREFIRRINTFKKTQY